MSGGSLSQAQLERYREDGFLFRLPVLSAQQAREYRNRYEISEERISDRPELAVCLKTNSQYVLPLTGELIRNPTILDAVESILGPDLLAWSTTFWIKEAHAEEHVTWHQDLHYWGLSADDEVTAWLALTPATVDNGCMRFVAGSHHQPVEHRDTFADNNLLSRGQEISKPVDEADATHIELDCGQMSLHHGRLFHASAPNRTDDRRIGVAIRYIKPSMRQVVGRQDYAWLVRGQDSYEHFLSPPPPRGDLEPAAIERHLAIHNSQLEYFFTGVDEENRPTPHASTQ